jgi:DNA polymerase-3 subunit beta
MALSLTGTDLEMEMVARVALIQPHEASNNRSGA